MPINLENVQEVIKVVNERLPKHGPGIIDPSIMMYHRMSNCIGRLGMIAAALIKDQSVPEESFSFLIGQNHLIPFREGRLWRAHTMLGITDTDANAEGIVIDANNAAFIRNTSDTDWRNTPTTVTDHTKVPEYDPRILSARALNAMQALFGPSEVRQVQHLFDVYSIADGLAYYQQHPDYEGRRPVVFADYQTAYKTLQREQARA